jgi:hypothetical protein
MKRLDGRSTWLIDFGFGEQWAHVHPVRKSRLIVWTFMWALRLGNLCSKNYLPRFRMGINGLRRGCRVRGSVFGRKVPSQIATSSALYHMGSAWYLRSGYTWVDAMSQVAQWPTEWMERRGSKDWHGLGLPQRGKASLWDLHSKVGAKGFRWCSWMAPLIRKNKPLPNRKLHLHCPIVSSNSHKYKFKSGNWLEAITRIHHSGESGETVHWRLYSSINIEKSQL